MLHRLALTSLLAAMTVGCASNRPDCCKPGAVCCAPAAAGAPAAATAAPVVSYATSTTAQSADYPIPAKELLAKLKTVLAAEPISLPAEDESSGAIVTAWREYPGNWHIARRWQERTRFHLTVTPDLENPTTHSHLTIIPETQERASTRQDFDAAPELNRSDRATGLLQQLDGQLRAHN